MTHKYLIVDGNSIGHAAQNGAKLTLGPMQVQAIYNFMRTLAAQLRLLPQYRPIVLWDGASWRNQTFPDYKANRDKVETKNEIMLAEQKVHYKKQVPHIKTALKLLGVPQVWAMNMEADDMAAIMTDRYVAQGASVILLTGDQDWIQLVSNRCSWRDVVNKRMVSAKTFEDYTGVQTPRQFVEVKALSGDTGDNINGVGGVGQKGAIEFIRRFGSFNNFLNQVVIEKTVDFKSLPKKFRDLVDDECKAITFERNINLMDLRYAGRPPVFNLQVEKGKPDAANFRKFCDTLLFKRITDDFDNWISAFPMFRELETLAA